MTETIDREAFIRPSTLAAIAACNARPTMEAATIALYGQPESAPVAEMGNDLHRRAQGAVLSWTTSSMGGHFPQAQWGDVIAFSCNQALKDGLKSWSVWCLQFALERVRDLIDKHSIEPVNVLTERRMDMDGVGFRNGGTADVVLVVPFKRVIVVDYKFGFLDQGDAEDHDQAQAYALAAADEYSCEDVEVWIIQPRAEKPHRMSGATFDAAALRKNRAWTQAVLRLARGDNPELTAGYSQCVYCRAFTHCPAVKERIVHAQEALHLIGPPTDADAWGEAADAYKLAEKWGADGKDETKAHLLANGPGSVTGWKLGAGRSMRSVSDVPTALQRIRDAGLEEAALRACSISLSKLEPQAADLIADLVVDGRSAPSLVQEKRGGNGL